MRPTSGSSVTAVNYYDHEYIHPMSPPVTYRNSNIRANILPGYESYRYHY